MELLQQVKERVSLEWSFFKMPKIFLTIILTAFIQFLHNAAHNFVHHLAGVFGVYGGPDKMLVDLGFKALDSFPELSTVPNDCLSAIVVIVVLVFFSLLFNNFFFAKTDLRIMQILFRASIVCSIAVCLRIVSFLVTILPAPAEHCSELEFNAPDSLTSILFHFDVGNGCSDLIFSSHMLYGLVATCALTHYLIHGNRGYSLTKYQRFFKYCLIFAVWFTVLLEGFAMIRQNRHYSIDVWTSLYAVPFTWIVVHYFIPSDPVPTCCPTSNGEEENNSLEEFKENTIFSA